MAEVLDTILAYKRQEIAAAKDAASAETMSHAPNRRCPSVPSPKR